VLLAQATDPNRLNDPNPPARVQTDVTRSVTLPADDSTVTKANKASGLIGMNVRNHQDERLGEIKDLVVDLHSGKIAYAVLSVGGFLGIGDKLIAVPSSAFTLSPNQDHLLLNADKARIENSPGFAKNAWPDVKSPDWDRESQYWLKDTAQGTLGTTRSGTGLGTDADRIQSGTRSSTDLNRPLDRTPDKDRTFDRPTTTTRESDRLGADFDRNTFRGRITAIDPETRMMTVQGPSGTREFKFTDRPTITLKDSRNPSLADLKVGFPVSVGFHEQNGAYVAHSVIRTDAPEVK
jgi:sporulation protein YlmC with PRC-barrel domain